MKLEPRYKAVILQNGLYKKTIIAQCLKKRNFKLIEKSEKELFNNGINELDLIVLNDERIECIPVLKTRYPNAKILVTFDGDSYNKKVRAAEAGMDCGIVFPFARDLLLNLLDEQFEKSELKS